MQPEDIRQLLQMMKDEKNLSSLKESPKYTTFYYSDPSLMTTLDCKVHFQLLIPQHGFSTSELLL